MSTQDLDEKKRIVVVEDEAAIVDLLGLILEHPLVTVQFYRSGEAGLAAIVERRPDLIILDVMLPGLDGWQIYDYIRSEADLEGIPIIMLTVTQRENAERRAAFRDSKINFFMNKPFDMNELRRKIEEMLEKSIWQ